MHAILRRRRIFVWYSLRVLIFQVSTANIAQMMVFLVFKIRGLVRLLGNNPTLLQGLQTRKTIISLIK